MLEQGIEAQPVCNTVQSQFVISMYFYEYICTPGLQVLGQGIEAYHNSFGCPREIGVLACCTYH